MTLSFIAAIGKNNELGKDNKLLWNLPNDMKHFKEITSGHPVIMGRKTFESIGRPLPNRRNIIITRDISYASPGVEVVHSLDEALDQFSNTDEEIFCIGGGEIFNLAFDRADKLYVTLVDKEFQADAFFPTIGRDWQEISREDYQPDEKNPLPYSFITYKKTA